MGNKKLELGLKVSHIVCSCCNVGKIYIYIYIKFLVLVLSIASTSL